MFIKRMSFLALLLLLSVVPALAGTIDELAKDLKSVSGYVVLPVQGEFLIDLDASQGVKTGDLFAVVQAGEKITHPVTGKVLGTLDITKGVLQVTQVKGGYSHARPVGAAKDIQRGDQIRRFENLRAAFWDYTGKGESVFAQVKEALPALDWQDYASAQKTKPGEPAPPKSGSVDLVLVLDAHKLTVRDGSFGILRTYPAPESAQPVAAASAPVQAAAVPYKLESAPAAAAPAGVRYEAAFPGFKAVGAIGFPTVTSDFINDGTKLLLAASDGVTIKIMGVGASLNPVAETKTADLAQVLALHWWQPAAGQLYLAMSGWQDSQLSSALYKLDGNRLTLVEKFLPQMFGTYDRDGDGRRELLLAQNFDRSMVWGTLIKEGTLKGKSLSLKEVSFELPQRFTVAGSLMADITGNGQQETIFVRDGLLYIYSGTKQLYKSPKMMGGTLARIIYEEQPNARETNINYAAFEIPPVAADLDGDGQLELLAVASDTSLLSAPGLDPGVKKSWLAVLKYRDNMFVKGTLGEELEVPLQGLTVNGKDVLFIATEKGTIFGKDGESQLLVFPLAN
ncbi:MAG: hypothetical protein R2940_18005 [Syntrophotaleaceae bacterium]